MPNTLFFVHDDLLSAEDVARPCAERGWQVEISSAEDLDAVDRIFESATLAAVILLDGNSNGCYAHLRSPVLADERTPHPLPVFVSGDRATNDALHVEMPTALFVTLGELPWVLKHLSFKARSRRWSSRGKTRSDSSACARVAATLSS